MSATGPKLIPFFCDSLIEKEAVGYHEVWKNLKTKSQYNKMQNFLLNIDSQLINLALRLAHTYLLLMLSLISLHTRPLFCFECYCPVDTLLSF